MESGRGPQQANPDPQRAAEVDWAHDPFRAQRPHQTNRAYKPKQNEWRVNEFCCQRGLLDTIPTYLDLRRVKQAELEGVDENQIRRAG
jgi:hypothetical protein